VRVVKNKVAPPFKQVELDLLFSEGISRELDLLDAALHFKIIIQSGSWFAFNDTKIAQGRDQVLQYLKTEQAFDVIYAKVMEAITAEKNSLIAPEFDVQIKENTVEFE